MPKEKAQIILPVGLGDDARADKARRTLSISRTELLGYIYQLHCFAAEFATDGDLTRFDAARIAKAVGWTGDAERFVGSLGSCGSADSPGLLVGTEDGRLLIDGWYEGTGKQFLKRQANTERMRRVRAAVRCTCDAHGDPVRCTCGARATHTPIQRRDSRFDSIRISPGGEEIESNPPGARGVRRTCTAQEAAHLAALLAPISAELADRSPRASVAQLEDLYLECGEDLGAFTARVREARRLTLARMRQRRALDHPMAYFWTVLRTDVELAGAAPAGPTGPPEDGAGEVDPEGEPPEAEAPPELAAAWAGALADLEGQMSRANFDTWLAGTRVLSGGEGRITLGVGSAFALETLESRLMPMVSKALSTILGRPVAVRFEVSRSTPEVP